MKVLKAIARAGLAAALAAMLLPGCGPSIGGGSGSGKDTAISQIWQVYHSYQKGSKAPPKGPDDLKRLERTFPAAIASIRNRDVLVYWGVGLDEGSEAASTVLAYNKDVPEKGGEVLMQDGTPRTMTAAEFQAAGKPAGATTDFPAASTKKKR